MPSKKSHLPDLSLNPNNVKVGDTVVKNNYIGIIIDSVDNNGNKVLQFWVKWAIATATVPTPELASSLQKIEHIPHDLVGTTFSDGSFVQCFLCHSGEVKAEIIKDSGSPVLFSVEQLQSKLYQPQYPTVNIYTLTIDPNLQQRVKLNQDTVSEYAIALSEGEEFPPIIVWRCEDSQLYLVDGFHRVEEIEELNRLDLHDQELKDLQWQFSFIATEEFDLDFFIESLIEYRNQFFPPENQEITQTINEPKNSP